MKKVKKILFIDDDEATNFIHQNITEREGFAEEIVTLSSPVTALDYLKANKEDLPCLIFVDMKMPGMDGFEFMDEFEKLMNDISKNKEGEKHCTFVAMLTTSILRENKLKIDDHRYLKMYITKPLTVNHFDEIFSMLNQ